MLISREYSHFDQKTHGWWACDLCGKRAATSLADYEQPSDKFKRVAFPAEWQHRHDRDRCDACISRRCDAIAAELLGVSNAAG